MLVVCGRPTVPLQAGTIGRTKLLRSLLLVVLLRSLLQAVGSCHRRVQSAVSKSNVLGLAGVRHRFLFDTGANGQKMSKWAHP